MALLSELVAVCEAKGVDKGPTLNVFARRLREAARLSQAGRGRGAAHMTFLDASRFLIACAGTDSPERAVDAETAFSQIVLYHTKPAVDDRCPIGFSAGVPLDDALAQTLQALAEGKFDRQLEVSGHKIPETPFVWLEVRRSHVGATLGLEGAQFAFRSPRFNAYMESVQAHDHEEQRRALLGWQDEIMPFGTAKNITVTFGYGLLRAVANLIAGKAS